MIKTVRELTLWVFVTLALVAFVTPTYYWYSVESVRVEDVVYCQEAPIQMGVIRNVHKNFTGTYSTHIRDGVNGTMVLEGQESGVIQYNTASSLPSPLTLEWWAPTIYEFVPCLDPGLYYLETCWTIYPKYLPKKKVCKDSNIFEIRREEDVQ